MIASRVSRRYTVASTVLLAGTQIVQVSLNIDLYTYYT